MKNLIDWLEAILALIGAATSVYSIALLGLDRMGYYSWISIRERSKKLLKKIKESGYAPELIVGLGRSGAILGGILAGNLGVVPITVVDRFYSWRDDKTREVVPILLIKEDMIRGKKILLVDAAPHTGETCKVIRDELMKMSPADIKVAALFKSAYTVLVPDFYINEVEKVRKMPWRFSGDYREDFTRRMK
jgi:hypoxanthine phosphoribosyltransferase